MIVLNEFYRKCSFHGWRKNPEHYLARRKFFPEMCPNPRKRKSIVLFNYPNYPVSGTGYSPNQSHNLVRVPPGLIHGVPNELNDKQGGGLGPATKAVPSCRGVGFDEMTPSSPGCDVCISELTPVFVWKWNVLGPGRISKKWFDIHGTGIR